VGNKPGPKPWVASTDAATRIASLVSLSTEIASGVSTPCWEYNRCRTKLGYGRIFDGERVVSAHRYSWIAHFGPIPDGLVVCHKCDNPPCCNPEHLFIGTRADNSRDMHRKGRSAGGQKHPPLGESHHSSKLTRSLVVSAREWFDSGVSRREISERLGVGRSAVDRIINRKIWKNC
jgi:hypothetical protein